MDYETGMHCVLKQSTLNVKIEGLDPIKWATNLFCPLMGTEPSKSILDSSNPFGVF